MKRMILVLVCLIMVLSFAGCGEKTNENSPSIVSDVNEENYSAVDATKEQEAVEEDSTQIQVNDVLPGSDADLAVRSTVSNFLDTFISCDFEAIKSILHEEDKWLFNFESEDQLKFYKAIFPQIKYNFEFVSEYEGVYGVMTNINSPDMMEVYGSVITNYLDKVAEKDTESMKSIVDSNTENMIEMIKSPQLKKREERLYIYVQYIDGVYIPRCDFYLANELTGGAPEASNEITSSLNETIEALN